MEILIVDDEEIILRGLARTVRSVVGEETPIYTAQDPYNALEIMKNNPVDLVFADVDMPGMNGLRMSSEIHAINPNADIVFATGYPHYSLDAWKTAAKDFLLKPVSDLDIRNTLDKLKSYRVIINQPASEAVEAVSETKIEARCFGNFDLFYKNKLVFFGRKKSKEMVAYLIDRRGATVPTGELRAILWEDEEDSDEKKGYVRVLANDIRKSFEYLGLNDVLINNFDGYSIDLSRFDCDYIDFLAGKKKAIQSFDGEYMTQYPWGEYTLSGLLSKSY